MPRPTAVSPRGSPPALPFEPLLPAGRRSAPAPPCAAPGVSAAASAAAAPLPPVLIGHVSSLPPVLTGHVSAASSTAAAAASPSATKSPSLPHPTAPPRGTRTRRRRAAGRGEGRNGSKGAADSSAPVGAAGALRCGAGASRGLTEGLHAVRGAACPISTG